jgi:signal transduction histidine kinase
MLDGLEAAEARAQRAQERMRQFLADASHDLRTPLAGIIAGSDALLQADFDELDRAEREQRLVAIVRQSRQAARLVDNLLLMARMDNRAVQHQTRSQRVDLVEVVRQQTDAVALRRPDLQVHLHAAADVLTVRIDPDELGRALANLLENAAQASPPGGVVTATVATRPTATGAEVTVTVTDDGAGVPADQRDRIFDRFVRLSTDRGGQGSGLGLPIARSVARNAGGDQACLPRPDRRRGARFELSLPAGG